jgi:hypothetical protein
MAMAETLKRYVSPSPYRYHWRADTWQSCEGALCTVRVFGEWSSVLVGAAMLEVPSKPYFRRSAASIGSLSCRLKLQFLNTIFDVIYLALKLLLFHIIH